jgi:hypothetical protein
VSLKTCEGEVPAFRKGGGAKLFAGCVVGGDAERVCVRVSACVRACVRVCMRVCMRACKGKCELCCVCIGVGLSGGRV